MPNGRAGPESLGVGDKTLSRSMVYIQFVDSTELRSNGGEPR